MTANVNFGMYEVELYYESRIIKFPKVNICGNLNYINFSKLLKRILRPYEHQDIDLTINFYNVFGHILNLNLYSNTDTDNYDCEILYDLFLNPDCYNELQYCRHKNCKFIRPLI